MSFVLVVVLAGYNNSYKTVPRDRVFTTETPDASGPSIVNNPDSNDDQTKSFPKVWKLETTDSFDLTLQTDNSHLVKTIDAPGAWKIAPGSAADFDLNKRLDVNVRVPYIWDVNLSSVSYSMKNSVPMYTFFLHGRSCGYIDMKYSNLNSRGSYTPIILKLNKTAPVTAYVSNGTFRYLFTVRQVTNADHVCHGTNTVWFVRLG